MLPKTINRIEVIDGRFSLDTDKSYREATQPLNDQLTAIYGTSLPNCPLSRSSCMGYQNDIKVIDDAQALVRQLRNHVNYPELTDFRIVVRNYGVDITARHK